MLSVTRCELIFPAQHGSLMTHGLPTSRGKGLTFSGYHVVLSPFKQGQIAHESDTDKSSVVCGSDDQQISDQGEGERVDPR